MGSQEWGVSLHKEAHGKDVPAAVVHQVYPAGWTLGGAARLAPMGGGALFGAALPALEAPLQNPCIETEMQAETETNSVKTAPLPEADTFVFATGAMS